MGVLFIQSLCLGDDRFDGVGRNEVALLDEVEKRMVVPGFVLEAAEDARIALVVGENLGPRFIEWNFVSSRKARIEQAKQDWLAGRFPTVPGDDKGFIPLPE